MKKNYRKPTVLIENFVLSEDIASCDTSYANNMDVQNMLADVQGFTGYFNSSLSCSKMAVEGQYTTTDGQQLCYHTSVGPNVFSS